MKHRVLSFLAVGALLVSVTACGDDDKWSKVDNANPVTTLESSHIQTEAGYNITIKGTVADNDGISSIDLTCPELFMKKSIDIISIYGEPLKEYLLDYTFKIDRYVKQDSYNVVVTITDIAGNKDEQNVTVTLDGDYTNPVFVAAPSAETTVLLNKEGDTIFDLEFTVTDNIGLDYVVVNFQTYDLVTKEAGEVVDPAHFPMTVNVYGEDTYEYSEGIILPDQEGAYLVTVEAYDKPAQNNEVRCTTVTGAVTVLGGVNFAKMYLADVATVAELNSDVFGVPMRVDKVGECQYRARYYNAKANTEIFFIPQKGAFSPICYGLDPTDDTKLINSPGNVKPLVLTDANQYYEITFNTESGEYKVEKYEVADYMDPIIWNLHSENLNQWFAYVDTGTDDYIPADDAWMRDFYFGYATGPGDVISFVQDKTNKHLYYLDTPMHFEAGEQLKFIIHNWHDAGWWNFVTWRVDDAADCDIFYYYGGIVKKAYLDWWFEQDVDWKQWKDGEDYRKQIIYGGGSDQWCQPVVNTAGNYNLIFDAHLGRAKMVPAN